MLLRHPPIMKVISCVNDEAGKGQADRIHIACKDGNVCGGLAIVDHRKFRTECDSD